MRLASRFCALVLAVSFVSLVDGQTIEVGPQAPKGPVEPLNTVGLSVQAEPSGSPGALSIKARGKAKLPDGCEVEGFVKHKVNNTPLSPTQAAVRGGAFEMEFGPFEGVFPGVYEVEVVFYPERAATEVQQALAKELGEQKWRSPSSAKATVVFGNERDPARQTAEFEEKTFETLSTLAARMAEVDRHVGQATEAGSLKDVSWVEPVQADAAKIADEAQKSSQLYGNPFVQHLAHRVALCTALVAWTKAEVEYLSGGKLPMDADGTVPKDPSGVLSGLRDQAFGALVAARSSGGMADLIAEDVRKDVEAVKEARAALKAALAVERKGPANASRFREAVKACQDVLMRVKSVNLAAVELYHSRTALSSQEKGFLKCREDLSKALDDASASPQRYERATGKWELSGEDRTAEGAIDAKLTGIEARLK